MMSFTFPVRLTSVEAYLRTVHGSDRALAASEIRVLSEYADRILVDVEDEWPVDTATSVDSFDVDLHVQRGFIGFDINNSASYAQYVHRKGGNPEAPLYLELIPRVVLDYRDALIADLKRAIDATEAAARKQATPPPPAWYTRIGGPRVGR